MAGRGTNLGLLVALVLATGTGVAAFAVGTPAGTPVVAAHGAAGLAVLVLAPSKQRIVRRGLRRPRRGRWAGLALLALVVCVVVAGVAHAAGLSALAGVTTMQVHVGAALCLLVPAGVHVATRRVRPRAADLARRGLLRAGAVGAGAVAVWGLGEAAYTAGGGPRRRFTGSHERGSGEPTRMPVTQWLFDPVPVVPAASWRLAIADAAGPRQVATTDLAALRQVARRAVLDCTGGWYAEQTWSGVALRDVLDVPADARRLVVTSITGYARAFPLAALDDLLLALRVADAPLSPGHGAPARLVAPGHRGFWWVKWVAALSVDDVPWWVQPPFPAR